jgi:hypothetical protein
MEEVFDIVPSESSVPSVPDNIPRWAQAEFDGDEIDFSTWMIGLHFWKNNFDNIEELMNDPDAMNRALAEAHFTALGRTMSMASTIDRAKVRQLLNAREEGWGQYLPSACASTRELLNTLKDNYDPDGSEIKDLVFIVDTLLPLLEARGIATVDQILSIPTKWSKTRTVVPALDQAIKELGDFPDELADRVKVLLDIVADDSITVREAREKVRQRGVNAEISEADVYLDGNDYLVVIRISHEKKRSLLRAVRSALKGIVLEWNEDLQISKLIKSIVGDK